MPNNTHELTFACILLGLLGCATGSSRGGERISTSVHDSGAGPKASPVPEERLDRLAVSVRELADASPDALEPEITLGLRNLGVALAFVESTQRDEGDRVRDAAARMEGSDGATAGRAAIVKDGLTSALRFLVQA